MLFFATAPVTIFGQKYAPGAHPFFLTFKMKYIIRNITIMKACNKWYWGLLMGIGELLNGIIAILSFGFLRGTFFQAVSLYVLHLKSKKN